jgi:hypothetical protein
MKEAQAALPEKIHEETEALPCVGVASGCTPPRQSDGIEIFVYETKTLQRFLPTTVKNLTSLS